MNEHVVALCLADQPGSRASGDADFASVLVRDLSREEDRPPYSTLGLAEDTWALNEGVIDDETFLKQTWDIDRERQDMCSAALDRLREGALVCVFDATDRVQHMFWRHVARKENAIEEQYRRNDAFLGQVMSRAERRRRADGAVRPRLQCVPARRQPQSLAARSRLSRVEAGRGRPRRNGCGTSTGRARAPTRSG